MKRSLLILAATAMLASCGGTTTSEAPKSTSAPDVTQTTKTDDSTASVTSTATSTASSNEEPPAPVAVYTVTFDLNYEGSTPIEVEVDEGKAVTRPADPTREGYLFNGWFLDETCENSFNFTEAISDSITVYASWIEDNPNLRHCTFYWNSEDAPAEVYMTVYFEIGKRLTMPAAPELAGHEFKGWYNEAECTTEFATLRKYEDNVVAYAKWFSKYTMEAEYTQLTGLDPEEDETCDRFGNKIGYGYSSNVSGLGLIFKDDPANSNCQASNGYYICDLYYRGAFIAFDIESDAEVTDALLNIRISAEYFDMTFSPDNYIIQVNGEAIEYDPIAITNVITGRDNAKKRDFSNHYITNALHLVKGKNVIKMITNNSTRHDTTGTMQAEAPMIDCIYVTTSAGLEFDAHLSNIKK